MVGPFDRSTPRLLLAALVLLTSLLGAACTTDPTPSGGERSMKGWELYSWQTGDTWRFALMIGTNRLKGWDEIRAAEVRDVIAQLRELAEGETVIWVFGRGTQTALPPAETVDEIQDLCRRQGLELIILEE